MYIEKNIPLILEIHTCCLETGEILMKQLSEILQAKNLVVTSGSGGAMFFDLEKNKYHHCPAFATKIVDKVGIGIYILHIENAVVGLLVWIIGIFISVNVHIPKVNELFFIVS